MEASRILKRRQNSGHGTSRKKLAIAFIAGMLITVALAQTPVAADMFSPGLNHEPVVPAMPDTTDTTNSAKPRISELVHILTGEVVPTC
ncbi:hypothetical protein ACFLX3_05400 [Chloroflexota bacterium]